MGLLALVGATVLSYTMTVDYSILTEAIGFIVLAIVTYLDYDLRRWARVKGGKATGRRHQGLQQSTSSGKHAEQI